MRNQVVAASLFLGAVVGGGCTLKLSFDPTTAGTGVAARGDDGAVARLTPLLGSEDAQVRAISAVELGAMGPKAKPAVPELAKLASDPDRHVRFVAARAMAQIDANDPATLPTLVLVANDEQAASEDRAAAVGLLGELGPRAAPATVALERLARAEDAGVRSAAEGALVKVAERTGPATRPVAVVTAATTAPVTTTAPAVRREGVPPIEPVKAYERQGPTTKPTQQALVTGSAEDDAIPKADLNSFGIERYSPERLGAVKAWIARQTYLTEAQKREHTAHFEEWNHAQEAKVEAIRQAGR